MTTKDQAHALKKRAKELGYDIKLTHAQEMVAALNGHKSRHSALLADKEPQTALEMPKNQVTRKLPPDEFEMSKMMFHIGVRLGLDAGKFLEKKTEEVFEEFQGQFSDKEKLELKHRVFNQSLFHGILKGINSTLQVSEIHNYFTELVEKNIFRMSGKQHLPRILKEAERKCPECLGEVLKFNHGPHPVHQCKECAKLITEK